ncbi:O-antigen ligase family protein [Bradyrhizobium liaoningense]|uniref:O-antigen ligase family protein n=1 Tax=Bradyrhizobium liaoningense TaxID=43992 RepID=UPI001BA94577|nr:O-antigen ligase family protein [Bradyrhizobium liaoningense]MBR0987616.1 O-antigen ligase family protein [Bradyrhizobium liaoningense]
MRGMLKGGRAFPLVKAPNRTPMNARAFANPDERLCQFVGMLDGCLFLSYLLGFEQAYFYAVSIGIKLLAVGYLRSKPTGFVSSSVPFLLLLLAAETASSVLNELEPLAFLRVIVFALNILATMNFICRAYWNGLFLANVGNASIYLVMLQVGSIENAFGRYFYYNLAHPNLGSELFFGASFAGLLSQRYKQVLFLMPLIFVPVFMMQGRAAELGIAAVAILCGIQVFWRLSPSSQAVLFVVAAISVAVLLLWLDVGSLLNKLLLLDDKYRGQGTDASGRSGYWAAAIQVWIDHPIFGAGSSYPSRLGVPQAHNFFLYALADYGLIGIALIVVLVVQLGSVIAAGYWPFVLPLVPMLIFNDRFINLNTYPTVMFLFVFAYFATTRRSTRIVGSSHSAMSGSRVGVTAEQPKTMT